MEEVGKTHGALTVTPTVLIAVATFPCQKTRTYSLIYQESVGGVCCNLNGQSRCLKGHKWDCRRPREYMGSPVPPTPPSLWPQQTSQIF